MRVYIVTDLEGVAGVHDIENWCEPASPNYARAKELLTLEVNAAIAGFRAAGATDILVADGHGCGGIANRALSFGWVLKPLTSSSATNRAIAT